jgi:hypothetical protein
MKRKTKKKIKEKKQRIHNYRKITTCIPIRTTPLMLSVTLQIKIG